MSAYNRTRWIWLTTALLLAGLLTVAIAAPSMANSLTRISPQAPLQADPLVQIAHLAPFAMDPNTVVSVRVDGDPVPALANVAFGDSTGYLSLPAGERLVEIFPAGATEPAIAGTFDLMEDAAYTLIAIGGANDWPLALLPLADDMMPPTAGHAKVRIGHLAPFAAGEAATAVDIRFSDGTLILGDVTYGDVTPYLELEEGVYDFMITTPGGDTVLINPMPLEIEDGDILSLFAVGDGANQPLGIFALPAGEPGFLLDLASRLQVAHLAPFAEDPDTAVTITLNGVPVLSGVEFADSTGYLPIPAGMHEIGIVPAGEMDPVITETFMFTHTLDFTVVAIGGANEWDLELLQLQDDLTPPADGFAKVRIGHLAPFAADLADTTADVRLEDGTLVLGDVPYGAVAPYVELPEGTYDLMITSPGGDTVLINPMPVTLEDGQILSLFAVGDGANQPLGAFALPAGVPGFLLDLAARLQVAHLAPFAEDPDTAVTITLNAEPVLSGVEFADSTGYLTIPAGMHEIGIVPAGEMDPVITETFMFTHTLDFTVVAIGGANEWDLELLQLQDDLTPPADGFAKVRIGHLAPFAADLDDTIADVRLRHGTLVLGDVPYGAVAPYIELPEGWYNLAITSPGGDTVLINPMPVMLEDGQILSLFAVGDGVNQPLGVFALPAGQPGFLLPLVDATIYLPLMLNNAQP